MASPAIHGACNPFSNYGPPLQPPPGHAYGPPPAMPPATERYGNHGLPQYGPAPPLPGYPLPSCPPPPGYPPPSQYSPPTGYPPPAGCPSSSYPSQAYPPPPPPLDYSRPSPGYPPPLGYFPPPSGYAPHGYPPSGYPPPSYPGYGPPCYSSYTRPAGRSCSRSRSRSRSRSGSQDVRRAPRKRKRGASPGADDPDAYLRLTLEEVLPRLAQAAREKAGSRFLCTRLDAEGLCPGEQDRIFREALPASMKLAGDLNGSAVVQRLVEKGTWQQRRALAEQTRGRIFDLSMNRYGSHIVQALVELLPENMQVHLSAELPGRVLECVENPNANHVIQLCIKQMPLDAVSFIAEAICGSALKMALHKYGCRVITLLIERCPTQQLEELFSVVLFNLRSLMRDNHGTYVVQCMLSHGRLEHKRQIMSTVCGDIVELAKHSVASSVVEKCFQVAAVDSDNGFLKDRVDALFRAVLGNLGDPLPPVQQLMQDSIGSHTLQIIVRLSSGANREALREQVAAAGSVGSCAELQAEFDRASGEAMVPYGYDQSTASKGSASHSAGQCKPCVWFWKPQGCKNGRHCQHCHLCPEGELKDRKKAKRARIMADQS